MIYVVRKCYAYDSQNIRCVTTDLSFAESIYDKELAECDLGNPSYEWVELLGFEGDVHYKVLKSPKTLKTSYKEKGNG